MDAGAVNDSGRIGPIEWAVAARPLPGQDASGDQAIAVAVGPGAAVFGVIDGLGHGPAAAVAARRAVAVVGEHRGESLEAMVTHCHRELASTRGAAMTLARIDFTTSTVRWVGVGNVAANLVARAPSGLATSFSALLAGGIVGSESLRVHSSESVEMRPGHLLVMTSDGITDGHLDAVDFGAPAETIAERILREHCRVTDDALVLVARHRGTL
jgi:negative regulator of sigma-B (phosphoserine phosphatase)